MLCVTCLIPQDTLSRKTSPRVSDGASSPHHKPPRTARLWPGVPLPIVLELSLPLFCAQPAFPSSLDLWSSTSPGHLYLESKVVTNVCVWNVIILPHACSIPGQELTPIGTLEAIVHCVFLLSRCPNPLWLLRWTGVTCFSCNFFLSSCLKDLLLVLRALSVLLCGVCQWAYCVNCVWAAGKVLPPGIYQDSF
jgi:hypothetical protein